MMGNKAVRPIPPYISPAAMSQYEQDVITSETMLDCFSLVYRGLVDRYPLRHGNVDEKEARALAAAMMASWPHFEKG